MWNTRCDMASFDVKFPGVDELRPSLVLSKVLICF
jgi:hypothetical protein